MLLAAETAGGRRDGRHGRRWGKPVGAHGMGPGGQVPLQLGHAHHEELVEVRADDGQELDALEKGDGRILGFAEHAVIELEPRQLAIDEGVGCHPRTAVPNVSRRSKP
jgi:hypothetical protein